MENMLETLTTVTFSQLKAKWAYGTFQARSSRVFSQPVQVLLFNQSHRWHTRM